jgi:hypothetical protein
MHMDSYKDQLVGKLKQAAVKAGSRGIHILGEGASAATKALEQLQQKLTRHDSAPVASREDMTEPSPLKSELEARVGGAAERIVDEARAVEERIKQAQPARRPLKVTVEATPEAKPRTQGRKTTATATAPKRATAPTGGFKAKRGQKHSHNH